MEKAKFLELARARFKQWETATERQRAREKEALRFYAGEQWEADLLRSRGAQTLGAGSQAQVVPARPSLTVNKTREPVRQVVNQERQSDMGIELIPADDFGEMAGPIDHTEIELREGLTRRIQRDSEAADARTWAFTRCAIAGEGNWVVMTRYVPGKSWDQEIYVDRLYNQTVARDPFHEQPDGSDAEWAMYGIEMPWDVYKAEHPSTSGKRNRVSTADSADDWRVLGDEAPDWITGDGDTRSVRVMNYYYTERESRSLVLLEDGSVEWADEVLEGMTPKETRTVVQKSIKWAKIDGVNILDETDWPGHYIPVIKLVGEELQPYDGERRSEGIVQPMMDACRGNNYIISKFVENVGLTPLPSWMGPSGYDEGYEAEYDAANTRTVGRLHYNPKDSNNGPIPPGAVSRTNISTDVQALAFGLQVFTQAIASTSVVPETALGHADPTVKSGKLAKMLLDQANRGTSNFLDNLMRSMRHEARIINDLLYPIYGIRPGRLARMMNPEGEMSAVLVGQPMITQGNGKQQQPVQAPQGHPEAKTYKLTKDAEWNVAIKISKNYDTRREQEAETLGEIISADPSQMGVIGDLFFKYQDGPGHEEMSERYKAVLVPPVQALLSGKQAPSPEMVQAQQQMQGMGQELQKLQAEKQGKMVESQADLAKAQLQAQVELQRVQMELASKEKIAIIQATASMTTAQAKIDAEDARTFVDAMEKRLGDALNLHLEKLGKVHEVMTQGRDHAHEAAMAQLEHQQTLEAGQQGHDQALEQGQQAASLAPEPTEAAP